MRNEVLATLEQKHGSMMRLLFYAACVVFQSSFFIAEAAAQDEPEYRMEIGGGMGLAAYQGDFNGSLLKGMKPMAAVMAKYKMNPRMAWSAQLSMGKLKGSSADADTWYPALRENPTSFTTSLTDFTVRYEYNFWPFGTGKEYLGAQRLTPFIALGAGLTFGGKPDLKRLYPPVEGEEQLPEYGEAKSAVAFQMPIGFGIKYKLRDRLNLTAEWMMHFTGTDQLDGAKDPYGIESSGLFKNTDCYSTLQVSLTYDLWAKCKTCHNDRD